MRGVNGHPPTWETSEVSEGEPDLSPGSPIRLSLLHQQLSREDGGHRQPLLEDRAEHPRCGVGGARSFRIKTISEEGH